MTKLVQRYQVEGVPVTIYDTPGIELGQSKKEVIREYKKTIKDSLDRPLDEHVHVVWYCMSAETPRVQDYDVDVIKALTAEVPVLLVLTQCVDDERAEALETAIAAETCPFTGHRCGRLRASAGSLDTRFRPRAWRSWWSGPTKSSRRG